MYKVLHLTDQELSLYLQLPTHCLYSLQANYSIERNLSRQPSDGPTKKEDQKKEWVLKKFCFQAQENIQQADPTNWFSPEEFR